MNFLTPVALFGLCLVPLIVLLHLRRRRTHPEIVPSLLVWREVIGEPMEGTWRLGIPSLPLLLLQVLAVAALVFSLARPSSTGEAPRQQVYVLDTSLQMAAADGRSTRLQEAEQLIDQRIAAAPSGALITVVVASAQPYLLISTRDRDRARQALRSLTTTFAPADLPAALQLASGTLLDTRGRNASILVVHAPEETLPRVVGPSGLLSTLAVGGSTDNQSIQRSSVRCGLGSGGTCIAYVDVRNEADQPIADPLVIEGDGVPLAERSLSLPARSDTGLRFVVPAGRHVLHMYIAREDNLPLDNASWVIVPRSGPRTVTLVGDATRLAPVQRAFAALQGVKVHVLPPARYTAADATGSDLLVLDGWLPPGALPPAPALLLVDPPRLPGGSAGGTLDDATISGLDATSTILAGVDLTSLDIPPGSARQLALPPGVEPVVWAAGGPLLAAGSDAGQRVSVLSFDPSRSNLTYLNAFPLLMRNLLDWSGAWLPPSAAVDQSLMLDAPPGTTAITATGTGLTGTSIPKVSLAPATDRPTTLALTQPGIYTVVERGSWGSRTGQVAVNVDGSTGGPATAPIALGAAGLPDQAVMDGAEPHSWWPWAVLVALLLIVVECVYVAMSQEV